MIRQFRASNSSSASSLAERRWEHVDVEAVPGVRLKGERLREPVTELTNLIDLDKFNLLALEQKSRLRCHPPQPHAPPRRTGRISAHSRPILRLQVSRLAALLIVLVIPLGRGNPREPLRRQDRLTRLNELGNAGMIRAIRVIKRPPPPNEVVDGPHGVAVELDAARELAV